MSRWWNAPICHHPTSDKVLSALWPQTTQRSSKERNNEREKWFQIRQRKALQTHCEPQWELLLVFGNNHHVAVGVVKASSQSCGEQANCCPIDYHWSSKHEKRSRTAHWALSTKLAWCRFWGSEWWYSSPLASPNCAWWAFPVRVPHVHWGGHRQILRTSHRKPRRY